MSAGAPSWRDRALHQLDIASGSVGRLDAVGNPRAAEFRRRLDALRCAVEIVSAREIDEDDGPGDEW